VTSSSLNMSRFRTTAVRATRSTPTHDAPTAATDADDDWCRLSNNAKLCSPTLYPFFSFEESQTWRHRGQIDAYLQLYQTAPLNLLKRAVFIMAVSQKRLHRFAFVIYRWSGCCTVYDYISRWIKCCTERGNKPPADTSHSDNHAFWLQEGDIHHL